MPFDHLQRPGATSGSGVRQTSRSHPLFLFFLLLFVSGNFSSLFPPYFIPSLLSFPCPLSLHLPGRDNWVPMESRDAAEGIFERELWLQTFHLVLYLAKAGCRVARLSESIHRRREEGWDKRRGREMKCNEREREKGNKKNLASLVLIIYLCFCQAQKRGSKWRWVRNRHQRQKMESREGGSRSGAERWETERPLWLIEESQFTKLLLVWLLGSPDKISRKSLKVLKSAKKWNFCYIDR